MGIPDAVSGNECNGSSESIPTGELDISHLCMEPRHDDVALDPTNPSSQSVDYTVKLPDFRDLLGPSETESMSRGALQALLERRIVECDALLSYQSLIHKKLKDLISQRKIILPSETVPAVDSVIPQGSQSPQRNEQPEGSQARALEELRKYVREIEEGLSALTVTSGVVQQKTSLCSPTDSGKLVANVNGLPVNLHFKNSGNNDINDIETYLQEKLDVLEFIQMDCNKMEMSQLPSSGNSKLYRAPQIEKSSLSVADWYGLGNQSIHVSQSDSFVESVHAPSHRSHLKELADDGFFIGTPSATSRSRIDVSVSPSREELEEESHLEWETSSIISDGRSMNLGRSTSRRRSISNSSVSSVDSSRSRTKPPRGMFGRGRLERLVANISGYSDESVVGGFEAPAQANVSSGWW